MRVLITGATGFVGKNLIQKMKREHDLHILVRPNSNWADLGISNVFEFSDNTAQLAEYLKEKHIDGIIHLASLYIAEHKTEQVKDIVISNVYLGTALLEACKIAGTKWFLNTGTIWQNYNAPDYSDEYHPVNLYSASKQAFMTMAQYYTETTDIRFCTLKLCDTYGPNDTRSKIFALFHQIAKSGDVLQMSPGNQKLDILHIDDVINGFLTMVNLLATNKEILDEYVLTSYSHISLKEIAETFTKVTGQNINVNWGGRLYRIREVIKPWKGTPVPKWMPIINIEKGIKSLYCN
jgi:nucleoside-diphosphate-sugar epimerase